MTISGQTTVRELSTIAVPHLSKLEAMFSNAAAPAFFLGAVAAFVSLMTARLNVVNERIRAAMAEAATTGSAQERHHLQLLRRRARLLHDGILLTLASGICATILLSILFISQFLNLDHAYGAALLFALATAFLAIALFRFAQEAWHARSELVPE